MVIMTVLAGMVIGDIMAIAADRGVTNPDKTIAILAKPKIIQSGDFLVGYYGSMEGQRLFELFDFPSPPVEQGDTDYFMHSTMLKSLQKFYEKQKFDTDDQENGLGLMIMINGLIYEHDICDGSMTRYARNYSALGSGGTIALGVLSMGWDDPTKAVEKAVGTAAAHNIYCRGPVDVISHKWRENAE